MLNNNHSLKSKWYHTKSGLSCNFAIWQTKMYWLYTLALYSHWQYFTLWYDVISWNLELNTNQSIIEILLVILSHAMFFEFFMSLVFYWNFHCFSYFFNEFNAADCTILHTYHFSEYKFFLAQNRFKMFGMPHISTFS